MSAHVRNNARQAIIAAALIQQGGFPNLTHLSEIVSAPDFDWRMTLRPVTDAIHKVLDESPECPATVGARPVFLGLREHGCL